MGIAHHNLGNGGRCPPYKEIAKCNGRTFLAIPPRMLRQFAGLWLLCFGGLAVWHVVFRGNLTVGTCVAVLAIVVGSIGLLRPAWIRWIFVGWMIAVSPIGWTVSRIVLAGLFYGCFTPLALLFRLRGPDALGLKRRPDVPTYWQPKPIVTDVNRYFQQF